MLALRAGPFALDAQTERAVRAFLQRLEGRYSVHEVILFGSRARRTHRPESDADLAIILTGAQSDRGAVSRDMAAIAFDVMLDTDVLVDAFPLWESEVDGADSPDFPLVRWLRRDGLRVQARP